MKLPLTIPAAVPMGAYVNSDFAVGRIPDTYPNDTGMTQILAERMSATRLFGQGHKALGIFLHPRCPSKVPIAKQPGGTRGHYRVLSSETFRRCSDGSAPTNPPHRCTRARTKMSDCTESNLEINNIIGLSVSEIYCLTPIGTLMIHF